MNIPQQMKDIPNHSPKKPTLNDRNRLQELYDAAPYPEVLADRKPKGTPLLEHWINAASGQDSPALHPQSNILVAGCGSGAEVLTLAQLYPQAQIVGVDFSERSIARAQALVANTQLSNIRLEVADLTRLEWTTKYAPFDFILCHGVADYVLDVAALMQTLAHCLSSNGVLYMAVNSPYHPAKRIQKAAAPFGITPSSFSDTPTQRKTLQMVASLMGNSAGIEGLGNAEKAYLAIDIFPPIAHHLSVEEWTLKAATEGLHFCGSMDAPLGLTELSDEQLSLLYRLGKTALSKWMIDLRQRSGMQLLFSKQNLIEPIFEDDTKLLNWTPRLAACVGQLPILTGDPTQARPMTLRFQNLPDFVIYSTAYELEVLRNCNGKQPIVDILKQIPHQGDLATLKACLFRAYHFGILSN